MIRHLNFRYRGPLESEKCDKTINGLTTDINTAITKMQQLLDSTKSKTDEILNNAKRRTSQ